MAGFPRTATRASIAATLLGCQLDTSGIGHASGLGSASSSSSGPQAEATSAGEASGTAASDEATGTTTVGSASMTTAVDETSSSAGTEDSAEDTSTGTIDPCAANPPFSVTLEASAATLAGTMTLAMLDNGQQYVYSATAETGSASFSFHTDCADEYAVWGHVYDADPLVLDPFDDGAGADRMRVDLGGSSTDWRYGCSTTVLQWSWQAVGTNDLLCTNDDMVVYQLAAGDHSIVFTPTEGGTHGGSNPGDTAALMRIIITNDLDFMP